MAWSRTILEYDGINVAIAGQTGQARTESYQLERAGPVHVQVKVFLLGFDKGMAFRLLTLAKGFKYILRNANASAPVGFSGFAAL